MQEDKTKTKVNTISCDVFCEGLSIKEEKEKPKERKNVLHVLEGACMEMDAVNRNNRIYPKELIVQKILNNESTNDLIRKHCLFGEGCHPETRLETIVPNICMSVEKLWIPKEDPQKLYGRFAILDTPTGRIVNTLLEYGAKIGVSARASGTSTFTPEGYELLNVDDYEFYTFDIVTEPGFACARPNLVESKSSKSIINEYKSYSKKELEGVKLLMEQYPSVFKTELSAVNSIINNNIVENNKEKNTTEKTNKSLKIQNERLKRQNENLIKVNTRRHIKEQTQILKLKKQVEELKTQLHECTKANNILEKKNKTLNSIVESQSKVLKRSKEEKRKVVSENISKSLEKMTKDQKYEENVKMISQKTNMNESKVRRVYRSLNDNINESINSIEKLTPYLMDTRKPTKVVSVLETKQNSKIQNNKEDDSFIVNADYLISIM